MALSDFLPGASNAQAWIEEWRKINNYNGPGWWGNQTVPLTYSTFAPEIMKYTPEEYKRAGIGLIPVAGRTIKWQPGQWAAALDRVRLQMQLEQSQAAQNAANSSQAAQEQIQTEAEKAAEAVREQARRAIGRRATILTQPRGVTPFQTGDLSGTSNSMKTLLGS